MIDSAFPAAHREGDASVVLTFLDGTLADLPSYQPHPRMEAPAGTLREPLAGVEGTPCLTH
jgi:hypothetical protein